MRAAKGKKCLMAKIRVLLVDDHTILRQGLKALLALSDDIEVIGEAGDGNDAISNIQKLHPDVVVMDMAMPGMDGLESTRRITRDHPQTKVLVLSQHDDERYILPVLRAGAMGYVLKRAAGEELVLAIRAVNHGESYLQSSITKMVLHDYQQGEELVDENDSGLTQREKEVLKLVAEGRTSQEIAELLHLSKKTVMCHRANIYQKLGTHNRTDLIKYAVQLGLVDMSV
jgi:DNA-binding NarL/FixJ family response regulator